MPAAPAKVADKENIPKTGGAHVLPADLIEKKSAEEQKRRASYGVVKNVLEQDSVHRKVEVAMFAGRQNKTTPDKTGEQSVVNISVAIRSFP